MGYIKDCIGDYLRVSIQGDTRSLEYSSLRGLGPGVLGFRLQAWGFGLTVED